MKRIQIKRPSTIDLGAASRLTRGKGSVPPEENGLMPAGGISHE